MDHEKSICTYLPSDPLRVVDIEYYVFKEKAARGGCRSEILHHLRLYTTSDIDVAAPESDVDIQVQEADGKRISVATQRRLVPE